jgi:hypothetical protein
VAGLLVACLEGADLADIDIPIARLIAIACGCGDAPQSVADNSLTGLLSKSAAGYLPTVGTTIRNICCSTAPMLRI